MLNLLIFMIGDIRYEKIFEEFYKENINFLLNYSYKILNDKLKAEEAVHEAFFYMIKNKEKYIKEDMVETRKIATTIVRGKSIDILRKEKNILETPLEELDPIIQRDKYPVEEKILENELIDKITSLLESLDLISSQIIIMKYYEKLTVKEIALALNMNEKNVETKLYRTRKLIKSKILGEKELYGRY